VCVCVFAGVAFVGVVAVTDVGTDSGGNDVLRVSSAAVVAVGDGGHE